MKKFRKALALIAAIAVLISGLGLKPVMPVKAANTLDTSNCVTFGEFSRTHTIPKTTIFVGTHLIALESATDEIWDIALETQTTSEQNIIYYYSELTDSWHDITDSESIRNINGEDGRIVETSELSSLWVEYYTFDLGVTRLAIDDSRHCIFDGEYPYYDLYHLEQLSNLRLQYDTLVSRNNSDSRMDLLYRSMIAEFYDRDLRNDVTDTCDERLYALQDVYDALCAVERTEDASTIYKLMAKLDNMRRAEIFRQLTEDDDNPIMDNLLNSANGLIVKSSAGQNDDEDEEEDENENTEADGEGEAKEEEEEAVEAQPDFITNYDVIDAISNDIGEVQSAYLEKTSNILEVEGARVIDDKVYVVSMDIINAAPSGLDAQMDDNIKKLSFLFNIDEDVIVDREGELKVLQDELIGPVTDKFNAQIKQTESDKYKAAKSSEKNDAVLQNILDEQQNEIDAARLELQDTIRAITDRQSPDVGIEFTADRVNTAYDMHGDVASSDLKDRCDNQIDLHIQWLTELLKELMERARALGLLDDLNSEYDDLLRQQQAALDDNRLDDARDLGKQAENLKLSMQDAAIDPNASAGDRAKAEAAMSGDSMNGAITKIKNSALKSIYSGNANDIGSAVGALGALGATAALGEIKSSIGSQKVSSSIMGMIDEGMEEDSGDNSAITSDMLLGLLEGLLGDLDSLSDDQMASAIRAMELLNREEISAAGDVASKLINKAASDRNKYVYSSIAEAAEDEYVRLKTLATVAGYRYVYSDSKKTATLTGAGGKATRKIYEFKVGQNTAKQVVEDKPSIKDTQKPEPIELSGVTMLSHDAYSSVDAAKKVFNCTACEVLKSSYGICLTDKLEQDAQELYTQLKEALDALEEE